MKRRENPSALKHEQIIECAEEPPLRTIWRNIVRRATSVGLRRTLYPAISWCFQNYLLPA
jgi:hypothetical protein